MEKKRIIKDILLVLKLSLAAMVFYYILLMLTEDYFWEDLKDWPQWLLVDFLWCFLCVLMISFYYFYRRMRMERERDKFRMQALENQLSPHFVFNNFSILADLIEVDQKKASAYLMDLSKVYHYTLSHLDHNTVTLQEELEFLHRYLSLLKQRFYDCIQVIIAPNVAEQKGVLPPATLQLIIENAIKHNEHTAEHPLIINVTSDGKYIYVSNHKRPITTADSTNIGHHNIAERYRLLTNQEIKISDKQDEYCITVPLITA